MSTEQRPSGYYFVIFDCWSWEVAKYDSLEERWQRFGYPPSRIYYDSDFDEIDPSPIIRNENE